MLPQAGMQELEDMQGMQEPGLLEQEVVVEEGLHPSFFAENIRNRPELYRLQKPIILTKTIFSS
jgi:hypothetical protein